MTTEDILLITNDGKKYQMAQLVKEIDNENILVQDIKTKKQKKINKNNVQTFQNFLYSLDSEIDHDIFIEQEDGSEYHIYVSIYLPNDIDFDSNEIHFSFRNGNIVGETICSNTDIESLENLIKKYFEYGVIAK